MDRLDSARDVVEEGVLAVVTQVTGQQVDRAVDNLDFLQLDSMAKLEILTLLEQRFDVILTEDLVGQFSSISRMVRLVARTVQVQHQGSGHGS